MKQVCFLLPDELLKPSTFFAALEIYEKANEFGVKQQNKPFYNVKIVGSSNIQDIHNSQFAIHAVDVKNVSRRPDLIIIPGLHVPNDSCFERNKHLINWMVMQYKAGAELASLCTGSFFLAATGLLKNKECSTHWKAESEFLKMFPEVKLQTDKIITDSKGIYTAGGAYSSLNLILYMIEKYNGREVALYCAKVLQIDIERNSQAPFIIFKGQKKHDDDQIKEVQLFIEANVEEKITVEYLSDKFSISKRSLIRRFKKATNNPPLEYIQRIKMEAAKRSLESNRKNINEVMYSVGYTDVKAFRNIFKKVTGLSPVEYKLKFSSLK